jgi:hypothetical protein
MIHRIPFYEPRVVSYHNDHGVVTAEVVMLHGYYAVELFTGPEESSSATVSTGSVPAGTEFYTMRRDAHAVAKCHTERYS